MTDVPDELPTSPATPQALGGSLLAVPAISCRAVDTIGKLLGRADVLDELDRLGYQGVGRTVPVLGYPADSEITAAELEFILEHPAAFGSWWYQRVRNPGWRPASHDPEADARFAVQCARAARYPEGTHGFVDAEGMSSDTTPGEAHAYNSAWAHVVREEGFTSAGAGLYDGYSEPETPRALYEIPDVNCYGSDAANRAVAVRGTSWVQGPEISVLGIRFDPSVVRADQLGGRLRWAVRSSGTA